MHTSNIINSEDLLQRFMGDELVAGEMLKCFRTNIPDLIETLHGHVAASDQAATLAAVKKILSLATCSSAITVQECASQMEHAAKTGNMKSVLEIMPLLEQKSVEAIGAINAVNSLFGSNLADIG